MKLARADGPKQAYPSPPAERETAEAIISNGSRKREGRRVSASWSRWVARTDAREMTSSEHAPVI